MTLSLIDNRKIRLFGAIALVFFGSLCGLSIFLSKTVSVYIFASMSVFGLGFLLFPNKLRPVFNAWLKITGFLGRICNILVLALSYYIVITPAALIKRVFGGTPLPTRPDQTVSTYWISRKEDVQAKEHYLKRF